MYIGVLYFQVFEVGFFFSPKGNRWVALIWKCDTGGYRDTTQTRDAESLLRLGIYITYILFIRYISSRWDH